MSSTKRTAGLLSPNGDAKQIAGATHSQPVVDTKTDEWWNNDEASKARRTAAVPQATKGTLHSVKGVIHQGLSKMNDLQDAQQLALINLTFDENKESDLYNILLNVKESFQGLNDFKSLKSDPRLADIIFTAVEKCKQMEFQNPKIKQEILTLGDEVQSSLKESQSQSATVAPRL